MKKPYNYIFVNFITTCSLFFAIMAIVFAYQNWLYASFGFVLCAFVTDTLDGHFARLLKAESRFGACYDTVVDIFVYLLYPAMIFYKYFGLDNPVGSIVITAFIFVGVFRLIRYTINGPSVIDDKKFYLGMPVVFSHLIIIISIVLEYYFSELASSVTLVLLLLMIILMPTKIKFQKPEKKAIYILSSFILFLAIVMFYI